MLESNDVAAKHREDNQRQIADSVNAKAIVLPLPGNEDTVGQLVIDPILSFPLSL